VIGWKTRSVALEDLTRSPKPGEKAYIMMMNGADETAGLMSLGDADYPGARTGWFTYFYVEDLEGALDRAIHQGGRIVREPVDVSDETRIAVIADPEGVLVGLASRPKD
jgi:predicted enzyme related to lactoylglutathione lyase